MTNGFSSQTQSVSEVTRSIKGLLGTHFPFVSILGEVSNLRIPYSGHTYFTLKDEQAQLRAVLFKQQQRYLSKPLKDGQQVVCAGRITVYEQRGEYQIIVDFVDFKGAGALQAEFERLKNKLDQEGLFDQSRKKPLPFLPQCIGLITSPSGAAVFDFLRMAKDRFPAAAIEIYPTKVQGTGALEDITEALQFANQRKECQVLILCRGGGSLEDLWTFNEEMLARAIAASDIPVVSAVGHEVDFTIADFVADFRAPTPTAAAEAVLPSSRQLQSRIIELANSSTNAMCGKIENLRHQIHLQRRMLTDPSALLQHHLLLLDYTQSAMLHAMTGKINLLRTRLQNALATIAANSPNQILNQQKVVFRELNKRFTRSIRPIIDEQRALLRREAAILDAVSPLAVLGRGYAIAKKKDGKVIRSTSQVMLKDNVTVVLAKGQMDCRVTSILNDSDPSPHESSQDSYKKNNPN